MMFSLQIFTRNILTNTSFLNKGKFKTKKRQKDKNAAKNIKRDSASTHVRMRRDMPSSCAQMYAFWMSPPPPPQPPLPFTTSCVRT